MGFSIGASGGGHGRPGHFLHHLSTREQTGRISGRVLLRLLRFVQPYWLQMTAAAALMLIVSWTGALTPYLTKVAIDDNILASDMPGLVRTSVLLAVVMAANYLAQAVQGYILSWVGQHVLADLRGQLFRHLQSLSVPYHDRNIVGVTISRVINDVAVINELLSQGLVSVLGDSVLLVSIIGIMLTMEPRLALLTFAVLPLMLVATLVFSRYARRAYRVTRERVGAVVGDLAENIGSMRVIQAFAQEQTAAKQFEEVNRANRDAYIYARSLSFAFTPVIDILSVMATCVIFWVGGVMVTRGTLTIGVVIAFLGYVNRFFNPIRDLSQIYTTLQDATAGGERVLELLDTVPAVKDAPGADEMPPIEGRVELRDVTFAYLPGQDVLRHVDVSVAPGETIALVGPTGAGKTSIANLVARFYDVNEGTVEIDGRDVRSVTRVSLHNQMGLVPQDPFLFAGTIAENIAFGRSDASQAEIVAAARLANADSFIQRLPEGYETLILEGGVNLSVGQRQLLCIARAVLVDPRILILDEATSSVDTMTEMLIQEALQRLLTGRTALVIAHRLSTVRRADRIYVIDDGRIVEQGSHEALLEQEGLYHDLYERQFIAWENGGATSEGPSNGE
jgi:ABC-type multidrug transport system fused ATPase/permease subunit